MEFEVTIQGITDYIDLILNQEKELTKRPDRYKKMCFRGHSDKEYRLLPSLARGRKFACDVSILNEERNMIEEAKFKLPHIFNNTLQPDEYYDILSDCSSNFQIWETIYCHALPSHQALVDWIKGTRLRPYLDTLNDENKLLFENEILNHVIRTYPLRKDGNTLLHFRRFFFIAIK